jgi:hypothetical protein
MQAERDALRDFVLPRVNEFAAQYGRTIEFIDLRWGVDTTSVSEAEQNYKVLRTSLDEIARSCPFFLALIGDRYGWTLPRQDMEAALQAADFSVEDMNMSVTALEIEYAVLRSKEPPVCFFYFRESPNYKAMPGELRHIYQDTEENCAKLAELKEKIRSDFPSAIKHYTPEINEDGLTVSKNWADMVADDIIIKLREEWGEPPETPLNWKEQERELQDNFRESRTEHFAGRAAEIAELVAFCVGEEEKPQYLMIQWKPGSGKSGLLCKVMNEIEDTFLLLPFSCGISPRSSLVENMLRYFISLLCNTLSLEDDSDEITTFQDVKDRFTELLFIACKKTRVVVIVDALDQFLGSDEARKMLWMNGKFPKNLRVLCSIIDGKEIEAFTQYGGKVRLIQPISTEDQKAIIHGIATRNHLEIGNLVVDHILKKQTSDGTPAAENPLYLSLMTQNFVMMGGRDFGEVQDIEDSGVPHAEAFARFRCQHVDEIPGDPEGAYLAIVTRLEKLIGQDFVRGICGLIAVSRSGLRESDMEGAFQELGKNFNPADFSW